MSMFKIFEVAGSALNAQSVRLNTVASNMANANVAASSPEQTYRARMPVFQAMLDQNMGRPGEGHPVQVAGIVESRREAIPEYSPGHPQANAEGYIYKPNISVAEEMANMMSASRSYQMNVEVMNTSQRLMMRTLRMGQN
jgi:flagellar basal-body rod protein FlgC